MNRLADMHEAPAVKRWAVRIGLAIAIAIGIGYLPGGIARRDARAIKLEAQLAELAGEARTLDDGNAQLAREIEALRTDVHAIEERARVDLGWVYPGELVLHVRHGEDRR